MEGKTLGIPHVLIVLVIAIVLPLAILIVALHTANIDVQRQLINNQSAVRLELIKTQMMLQVTPTPILTPTVTPTPSKAPVKTSSSSAR